MRERRSAGKGALRGALVGTGAATAVTLVTAALLSQSESMAGGFVLDFGFILFVPASAVLGTGIGALMPGGRWVPIERGSVAVGLTDSGPGVRVRF